MGLDITVLTLDWGELARTPEAEREGLLYEAMCPEDEPAEAGPEAGWVLPASPRVPWCARYEFSRTLGSYKPHFWASEGWYRARPHAAPPLRDALDAFLRGLIWPGDDPAAGDDEPSLGLVLPARPRRILACPPSATAERAAHWARAEPLLAGLRGAYDRHAAAPGGWIPDFAAFAALVGQWGEVVTGAAGRAWGVLGLTV
ncbi:hypothetical protein [Streptomyces griseosporeus]|uniref:hypothetical protein n=1 Tax=Streptomyces griseosporeus TaxID=1910 RepID=UPI0037B0EB22